MADNTLFWHDYETCGIDPLRNRPVQFAGVRTDEDLHVIGEPLNIFARPSPDVLPHPRSALITGITPQNAQENGVTEDEFVRNILAELAQPGTCGVGYNSIRFDDEVTRATLYRNLYDPYGREWQNGNSRWDIIDLVRICRDLRPEGIVWPVREENGRTSFKLEELASANGVEHQQAHDALSDVYATIAIARMIKEKQPKLYHFCYNLRRKQEVIKYIDLREMTPLLHTSGMYGSDHGNTRMIFPLRMHPVNKNSVIVFDLSQDPAILLDLGHKKLRELLYTAAADLPDGIERPALKQMFMNRCPVISPLNTLDGEAAERLQIDLMRCRRNRQTLLGARREVQEKIAKVFQPRDLPPHTDPDLMLYSGGFFSDVDRRTMQRIHASAPEQLGQQTWSFEDPRLPEMVLRFRARNYPETLTASESEQWLEHCRQRLLHGDSGHMSFAEYLAEIEQIRNTEELDEADTQILTRMEEYGQELQTMLLK